MCATPPPDSLAGTFAALARELQAASTPVETRDLVTRAAVRMVPGAVHAAISLVLPRGRIRTAAATAAVAERLEAIQYELGQGPCLAAIRDHPVCLVEDLARERRWPGFGERAIAETGIVTMLSMRLFTAGDTAGALNLYGTEPFAFTCESQAVAAILAAHAALALAAAADHERVDQLNTALQYSREIGTAIGILVVRNGIGPDQAFEMLVDASQRLNRKLRDVAAVIIDYRGMPDRRTPPASS